MRHEAPAPVIEYVPMVASLAAASLVSVPQIMEETVGVALAAPVVDVFAPQSMEEITEVVRVLPQEPVPE